MHGGNRRYREVPVANNSVKEFTAFGYPVQKVANVACAVGIVVALLTVGFYALKVHWNTSHVQSMLLTGGAMWLFICWAVAAHVLLVMSINEGDGTLIGAASCGYTLYCLVVYFVFYLEFMTSVFPDSGRGRSRGQLSGNGGSSFVINFNLPNTKTTTPSPPVTPEKAFAWFAQMFFRVFVVVTHIAVGSVYVRCNQLFKYKQQLQQKNSANANSNAIP